MVSVLVWSEETDLLFSFLTTKVRRELSEHRVAAGGDISEEVLVQIFSPLLLAMQYLEQEGEVLDNIETEGGMTIAIKYYHNYIILAIFDPEESQSEVNDHLNFVMFMIKSVAGTFFHQLKNHKTRKVLDNLFYYSLYSDRDLTNIMKCILIKPIMIEEQEKLKSSLYHFIDLLHNSKLQKGSNFSLLLFDIETLELLNLESNFPERISSRNLFFIQFYLKSRLKHIEIDEDGALMNILHHGEPGDSEIIFLDSGSFHLMPVMLLIQRCAARHVIVLLIQLQDRFLEILQKMIKLCQPHFAMNEACHKELEMMGKKLQKEITEKTVRKEIMLQIKDFGREEQGSELMKIKKKQFIRKCQQMFIEQTTKLKDSITAKCVPHSILKQAELFFLKSFVVYHLERDVFKKIREIALPVCNILVYDSCTHKSLHYKFPTKNKFALEKFKDLMLCIEENIDKMSFSKEYSTHSVYFLKFFVDDLGNFQELVTAKKSNLSEIRTICVLDKTNVGANSSLDFGCLTLLLVNLYSSYAHRLLQ